MCIRDRCIQCSGNHTGGTPPDSPTEIHQRMVWLDLKEAQTGLFASVGGAAAPGKTEGNVIFHVFRHAEDFTSAYNVQLFKFDHETGKPLENARFVLYERFDDKGELNTERDGPAYIYKGGSPYASYHKDNPAIWDGFRRVGTVVTDQDGHGKQRVIHGYHYDKTFCNGHPAPVFLPVPEPEEDEETGEILNSSEIEQAKAVNQLTAKKWLATAEDLSLIHISRTGDRKRPQIMTEVKDQEGNLIAKYLNGSENSQVQVIPVRLHAEHNGQGSAADRTVPVSYTHLDVYKRQTLTT